MKQLFEEGNPYNDQLRETYNEARKHLEEAHNLISNALEIVDDHYEESEPINTIQEIYRDSEELLTVVNSVLRLFDYYIPTN